MDATVLTMIMPSAGDARAMVNHVRTVARVGSRSKEGVMRMLASALAVCALVACGGGLTGPSSPALPTAPSPGATCGTVVIQSGTAMNGPAATAAEDCFWHAYQQCAAASPQLAVQEDRREVANEFVTSHVFTLVNANNQCTIVVHGGVQHLGLNAAGTPFAAPGSYILPPSTCARMRQDAGGLHIRECVPNGTTYDVPRP